LADGLRSAGVAIADLRGMIYNPLADRWSYGPDLAVNYLAFAIRP
jgi:2-polyprenyl-3-methyl-5-hydroxy-6-metoxy-1,4-benzoquinol methylase